MQLLINSVAANRTSLGGRRYLSGVLRHLGPGVSVAWTAVSKIRLLERPKELLIRGRDDSILWSPAHRGPLFARNHVVTALDCLNIEYQYKEDWRRLPYKAILRQVFENAVFVVAISHATRKALLRNYSIDPAKVVVISGPNDLRDELPASSDPETTDPVTIERTPFVLMFSNLLPHKNTTMAGVAFANSAAKDLKISLRVVGQLPHSAQQACLKAGARFEQFSNVDDATLTTWLKRAIFLLSPSLDEGLNLPIGEALSVGANVLCSDIEVHREFYDGRVSWFDPTHLESITLALDTALRGGRTCTTPAVSPALRTFSDVARDYEGLFKSILED